MTTNSSTSASDAGTRRSRGCPPAAIRTHHQHASTRVRAYSVSVFHPDLTPAQRAVLLRGGQASPGYALAVLVGGLFTGVCGQGAAASTDSVALTTVFGLFMAAFALLACWGAAAFVLGRREPARVRAQFKKAHPGQERSRGLWIDVSEVEAFEVASACVKRLTYAGRSGRALHERLWATRQRLSPLDVAELRALLERAGS